MQINHRLPSSVHDGYSGLLNTYHIVMRARQIVGWVILIGGAAYAFTKAEPLVYRLSHDGTSLFLFALIALALFLAIRRILRY